MRNGTVVKRATKVFPARQAGRISETAFPEDSVEGPTKLQADDFVFRTLAAGR